VAHLVADPTSGSPVHLHRSLPRLRLLPRGPGDVYEKCACAESYPRSAPAAGYTLDAREIQSFMVEMNLAAA
jgi:hypothetical protein